MKKTLRILLTPFFVIAVCISYLIVPIKAVVAVVESILHFPEYLFRMDLQSWATVSLRTIKECTSTNFWYF